jgi:two-component system phosphate regulon sensor histidine kinase PhoR
MIIRLINLIYSKSLTPDVKLKIRKFRCIRQCAIWNFFKDIASAMPLQERVSAETLKKLIKKELEVSGVKQNLNL